MAFTKISGWLIILGQLKLWLLFDMFIAITVEIYRNKGSVGVKLILIVKKNILHDNPSYRPRNECRPLPSSGIKCYKK